MSDVIQQGGGQLPVEDLYTRLIREAYYVKENDLMLIVLNSANGPQANQRMAETIKKSDKFKGMNLAIIDSNVSVRVLSQEDYIMEKLSGNVF